MSDSDPHRFELADLMLFTQVEETFRPKFSNDEWEALRTPRDLLDALERRGLVRGDRPPPQRIAVEREVRAALSEALGRDAAGVASDVSMRELFGEDRAGWKRCCRQLELDPSYGFIPRLRCAAKLLLCIAFLLLLGELVRRDAAAVEFPLGVALVVAALTVLLCLWIIRRWFAWRPYSGLDIEALVERRLLRELQNQRLERGNLSRAQAFAWLQAQIFFLRRGDEERSAPAQGLGEDQPFLDAFA